MLHRLDLRFPVIDELNKQEIRTPEPSLFNEALSALCAVLLSRCLLRFPFHLYLSLNSSVINNISQS